MVEKIFSTCRRALGSETWGRVLAAMDEDLTTQSFPDRLASLIEPMDLPGYIADLARLEWILREKASVDDPKRRIQTVTANPTLTIVPVRWKNLVAFIRSNATDATPLNEPAHVIVWRHPESGDLHFREAGDIDRIRQLLEIDRPLYFQISLEGLEAHNDTIRGKGHFNRSLAFLEGLRDLDIFSMVMLTLTRDNLAQVLPLAKLLEDRADAFTFNRLSTVGKGAQLLMPEKAALESFLRAYDAAAAA